MGPALVEQTALWFHHSAAGYYRIHHHHEYQTQYCHRHPEVGRLRTSVVVSMILY